MFKQYKMEESTEKIVSQRIIKFTKAIGITQKAFEENINASQGYINNISKSIGFDKLNAIKLSYPQLNIEWLLTGAGEMLDGKKIGEIPEADKNKYIATLERYNARLEHDVQELEKRLSQYERDDSNKKIG